MRIGILGPLTVHGADGAPVDVAGVRLRTLLLRLVLGHGRPVTADALTDAVWADAAPAGSAAALQALVSRLRRALPAPATLTAEPAGYRLSGAVLDADEFTALADTGRAALDAGAAARAAEALRAALTLWRGTALADAADAEFARVTATRLEERRTAAVEDLAEARLRLGEDDPDLVTALLELAAGHPLRERPHALAMRALRAAGRTAEALQLYATLRATLAEELGVDPSPELAALHLALLEGAPRTPRRGNLPAPLTSFVGRGADLARLDRLLRDARLVTLVGPGGAGKTRLAVEAARGRGRPPGGAWLVELAPVREPADVPRAVLDALGLRESRLMETAVRDPRDRLIEDLTGRELLLVLDNCEHVVHECAQLADALLAACPGVRILATSREPLAITGEALCPVGPLPVPPPDAEPGTVLEFPSVRLLADRAAAVRPGFRVADGNVADVVEICRRLDGLPLAIELAAARLRTLPVAELAARLGDRFRLLTGGSRTALPRHQTLTAVVAWSWDLLDEAERRLARRLSVFLDGTTLEGAERVCGGDPATLGGLVDKSLVTLAEEDGRYRMLETIRVYAGERLAEAGEAAPVRDAHARHFLELAEAADPKLRTGEQLPWLARLRAERDNLTAALRWAVDSGDAATAVRLSAALGWYWSLSSAHSDGVHWPALALALPGEVPAGPRAVALATHGLNLMALGDLTGSQAAFAQAGELDPDGHPLIALTSAIAAVLVRDLDRAHAALPALLEHPDPWVRGIALFLRGRLALAVRADEAEPDMRTALAVFRAVGDRWGQSVTIGSLAEPRSLRGDHLGAVEALRAAVALSLELGVEDDAGIGHHRLAQEWIRAGDLAAARAELDRGAGLMLSSSAARQLMHAAGEAELARAMGRYEQAIEGYETTLATLGELPGLPEEFEGNALAGLVYARLGLGDLAGARRHQAELDKLADRSLSPEIATGAAQSRAALELAAGDPGGAARWLGYAEAIRGVPDRGSPDVARTAGGARAALGEAEYSSRYAAAVAERRARLTAEHQALRR